MKTLGCLGVLLLAAGISVGLGFIAQWCVGLFGYHGAPWYAYSVGILLLGTILKPGRQ